MAIELLQHDLPPPLPEVMMQDNDNQGFKDPTSVMDQQKNAHESSTLASQGSKQAEEEQGIKLEQHQGNSTD